MKRRLEARVRALGSDLTEAKDHLDWFPVIDRVRRTRPPESVWGLAGDIATHLTLAPRDWFPPPEAAVIREGMARRWLEAAEGHAEDGVMDRQNVLDVWRRYQFAGIPPLRAGPLRTFYDRHTDIVSAIIPIRAPRGYLARVFFRICRV